MTNKQQIEEKEKICQENQRKSDTGDDIYQIFDKIFKKVITLSSTAVINLINALFNTDYPTDSTITYNWTEFEDDRLRKILADTILTINGHYSYHLEAQIENDTNIVFRVFEDGYFNSLPPVKVTKSNQRRKSVKAYG